MTSTACGSLMCALLLALWPAGAVQADPMRPLPATQPALAGAVPGDATMPGHDAAAAGGHGNAGTALRRLLAIRHSGSGERLALMGDRWLRVGDRYTAPEGETVVLAIGAHHVEVAHGKLHSTLHLLAPLIPPQWPTLPAPGAQAAQAAGAAPARAPAVAPAAAAVGRAVAHSKPPGNPATTVPAPARAAQATSP